MISKLKSVYEREGSVLSSLLAVINFALNRSLGIKISKSNIVGANKIARRVFKNRHLKDSKKGYLYVDPMPSEDELTTYYTNVYWGSRTGKNHGARLRDLVHYNLLTNYIPDFFKSKNKLVINFGAGHGGISHLFWINGFKVVNIEPSGLPKSYCSRWKSLSNFDEIEDGTVDLIYGSHSLEHVQNIDKFKKEMRRILSPNAFLFWEVPNAKNPLDGAMNNRIDIPHTYYFSTEFFDSWFSEVILNDAYDQSHDFGIIERWADFRKDNGAVIRTLGRL